mmetsp:Transcript_6978/g.11922  ORF Transcript_6978/g.11922 Transcript_6978/m.11922 type:complete len:230 (+) Transcript_6978:42-731(+)
MKTGEESKHDEIQTNQKVHVCGSNAVSFLLSKLRDNQTSQGKFVFYANRLMRILAEEGISYLPRNVVEIQTPTGSTIEGVEINEESVCAVSIIRSGDTLLNSVQECIPFVKVGKILIQRDEESSDKKAVLYYKKLPSGIASMQVLLCDPMLATGGSALKAIEVLVEAGVLPENIIFILVIACPEGISAIANQYPDITIVAGVIDSGLNDSKYIVPGLGDYGDRFFGTVS